MACPVSPLRPEELNSSLVAGPTLRSRKYVDTFSTRLRSRPRRGVLPSTRREGDLPPPMRVLPAQRRVRSSPRRESPNSLDEVSSRPHDVLLVPTLKGKFPQVMEEDMAVQAACKTLISEGSLLYSVEEDNPPP